MYRSDLASFFPRQAGASSTKLAAALVLGLMVGASQAATASPAQRFDLSHWALTLPVNASGLPTGSAQTLDPDQLTAGYSSQWFYVATDGGVSFYVPATGATTDTAGYPRSELREEIQPPLTSVNWYTNSKSYLDATVAVNKAPASGGKVLIGQIHAVDAGPLAKIYFQPDSSGVRGSVFGQMLIYPNGTPSYKTWQLASKVPLNKQFTYNVSVMGGVLKMSVNGGTVASKAISSNWASSGLYFKAGNYPNTTGQPGDDSRVTFYSVLATHQ